VIETARIPLRARNGVVRAYAVVDVTDLPRLEGFSWSLDSHGYAGRSVHWRDASGKRHSRRVGMHRAILGLRPGDGKTVDHINHDKLDNRRSNLRVLSHADNNQNRKSGRGRSRFRGVAWNARTQSWRAQAVVRGRCHYLGLFESELDAARAAEDFRKNHMPAAMPDRALQEVA